MLLGHSRSSQLPTPSMLSGDSQLKGFDSAKLIFQDEMQILSTEGTERWRRGFFFTNFHDR